MADIDSKVEQQPEDEIVDFDTVFSQDEKMRFMFEDLAAKGYEISKICEIETLDNEEEENSDNRLYFASARISKLGEFSNASRHRMLDAIRGVALKLKFALEYHKIGIYDLRPEASGQLRGNRFGSPLSKYDDSKHPVSTTGTQSTTTTENRKFVRIPSLPFEHPSLNPPISISPSAKSVEQTVLVNNNSTENSANPKSNGPFSSHRVSLLDPDENFIEEFENFDTNLANEGDVSIWKRRGNAALLFGKKFEDFILSDMASNSANSEESKVPNDVNDPRLQLHLSLRANFIKKFNMVFALTKSTVDVLYQLNNDDDDEAIFTLETIESQDSGSGKAAEEDGAQNGENQHHHVCSFTSKSSFRDIIAFKLVSENYDDSRDCAIRVAFDFVQLLSELITKFQTIHSITHNSTTIMREILPKFRALFKITTIEWLTGFKTTINLLGIGTFDDCCGDTIASAQRSAFELVTQYLKRLTCLIYVNPKLLAAAIASGDAKPQFSPPNIRNLQISESKTEAERTFQRFALDPMTRRVDSSTGEILKPITSAAESLVKSNLTKRIELIKNFYSVFSSKKQPIDVLQELIACYQSSHNKSPISISTIFDAVSSTHKTTIRLDQFASITQTDLVQQESVRKAQLKAFNFLKNLTAILMRFRQTANEQVSVCTASASLDLVENLLRRLPSMMKMHTVIEHKHRYKSVLRVVNFNPFIGIGSTEAESREAAALNATDYFHEFAELVFA